jgi:hypothetical protein
MVKTVKKGLDEVVKDMEKVIIGHFDGSMPHEESLKIRRNFSQKAWYLRNRDRLKKERDEKKSR